MNFTRVRLRNKLSEREQRFLQAIVDQNKRGNDCLLTNRQNHTSVARVLEELGLVAARKCFKVDEKGAVYRCSFRWAIGYELTELGRTTISEIEKVIV